MRGMLRHAFFILRSMIAYDTLGDLMAYRIRYEKKQSKLVSALRTALYSIFFFLAFVYCTFQNEQGAAWDLFSDAAENMICRLQNGGNITDAVSAFCQGILYD